jgi:SAM-dependent methyltransferase
LLGIELQQQRQGGDHRVVFGTVAAEVPADHPCAFSCAAVTDREQPAFLRRLDDIPAGHRRQVQVAAHQMQVVARQQDGEAFVNSLGITKGLKVLDLGCGDGTTALPEARLGADVLGVDIAANLVEAGNRRAKEAGLANCRFQEGDASNLHELKDNSFDLVVSMFGAMFAPRPFDVAKEMVRVTRSGRRIVMGNWIPGDPTLVAQILKISSSYSPPPPEGFVSPMTWGIEDHVIERFAGAGIAKEKISFVRDTYTFDFPGTPFEFVDAFRKYYRPTMNAFEAAENKGRASDLQKELEDLFNGQNTSTRKDATSIPATFLRVTVTA